MATTVEHITPRALADLRAAGPVDLIDVRTPAEYGAVHVDGARLTPLESLDVAALAAERRAADRPLYVICAKGGRAKQACEKLVAAGVPRAICVEGGTTAWDAAGLPVVRGQAAISLERQVRIVAGAMVLAGVILGWTVHPYWTGLSAFVGAGLMFAGITDTCGMALMLARMPWNQRGGPTACKA